MDRSSGALKWRQLIPSGYRPWVLLGLKGDAPVWHHPLSLTAHNMEMINPLRSVFVAEISELSALSSSGASKSSIPVTHPEA